VSRPSTVLMVTMGIVLSFLLVCVALWILFRIAQA